MTDKKENRLFAPFRNINEQKELFENLIDSLDDEARWSVILYMGRLESTVAEGYNDVS
tara:strand:+ start:545 stop:718 length:174 start_codon:yes stop_codon:yes gene_type:complete